MIGTTTDVNEVSYIYKVERDAGKDYARTYEVAVFAKPGNRINILIESTTAHGSRTNVGSIVIPLPDDSDERGMLADALSTFIREA
jgi:hypothetical protein